MLTVEKIARGDNLRPVRPEKVRTAEAFATLVRSIDAGVEIERPPAQRRDDDAEGR